MFGLTELYIKGVAIGSVIILILSLVYFGHIKPINDLEENVKDKQITIDRTKEAVQKENAKIEPFEDKWKTIKVFHTPLKVSTPQEDNNDTKIDTSIGEHSIAI